MRDLGVLFLILLPAGAGEEAPRHRALIELFTSEG